MGGLKGGGVVTKTITISQRFEITSDKGKGKGTHLLCSRKGKSKRGKRYSKDRDRVGNTSTRNLSINDEGGKKGLKVPL